MMVVPKWIQLPQGTATVGVATGAAPMLAVSTQELLGCPVLLSKNGDEITEIQPPAHSPRAFVPARLLAARLCYPLENLLGHER